MELNESIAQDLGELVAVGRMSPERVVDRSKGYTTLLALGSGHHHVTGIERVDVIGRQS